MSRHRRSSGFSLIETIVAVCLSSVVLMGVFSLMTSMIRNEISGMRDGTVTAWSLASIGAMNNDIPAGSYLSYPVVGAAAGSPDGLVICTNWAPNAGGPGTAGPVNPALPVYAYEYCYDTLDGPPFANTLLRQTVAIISPATCPTAPPTCNSTTYTSFVAGQSAGSAGLVATGVYRLDYASPSSPGSAKVFTADPTSTNGNGYPNAVDLQFIVGMPKAGVSAGTNTDGGTTFNQTDTNVPQSVVFQTKIILED